MKRRQLLGFAAAVPLVGARRAFAVDDATASFRAARAAGSPLPSASQWSTLERRIEGHLFEIHSPFEQCNAGNAVECNELFRRLRNPYYIRDEPALTQTLGWLDAWNCAPSAYGVAPTKAEHVAAVVDFARTNRVRLAIKGGGHAYQGTSNAPDSLLLWMRNMDEIKLHDAFVGTGCSGKQEPAPAVSIGAGAIWIHVYEAVASGAGRYVQGGGCATVGVAGLVQSGGFGSFSKKYGTAAGSLLEAEIVTADGALRVVNRCRDPDLFWALGGGGGGTFGVVTRVTLRTHDLPQTFGAVFGTVDATSNDSFRELIGQFLRFYCDALFNPHWGEVVTFRSNNQLRVAMLFEGLTTADAKAIWNPFLTWLRATPHRFVIREPFVIAAVPARKFWDPAFLRKYAPDAIVSDNRRGASPNDIYWHADAGQAGQYIHGYTSTWLPATLLAHDQLRRLGDAIFDASRHCPVGLHFNKGLAGANASVIDETARTAMHPAVLHAFALAIVSAEGPPAHPAVPHHTPDVAQARDDAGAVRAATIALRRVVPQIASYVAEGDYFEADWHHAFWGEHYARLRAIKRRYDPHDVFTVHHGVGSEDRHIVRPVGQ